MNATNESSEPSLFQKVDHYIAQLVAPETEPMQAATQRILAQGWGDQSISPVQGKMLEVMARACHTKRILELGTFGAYSTLWLAQALPENGYLLTIESSTQHALVAKQTIETSPKASCIDLRVGRAMDILHELIQQHVEPFDFIFIDADKPPYKEYMELAIRLSRPGTLIVCDNVIRGGKILDPHATDEKVLGVQRLNTFLQTCTTVTATILQTIGSKEYDGMVLAVVNE